MATGINDTDVTQTIEQARLAARNQNNKTVLINGSEVSITSPYPSPADWRDCWIYFLMLDRFASDRNPPRGPWNQRYYGRQGGTFKGLTQQLNYLRDLGANALWISPILKNPKPWEGDYHGYAAQDFLNVDERFASDGTRATAEKELNELVDQAHARDMYVILDIVLNHAGRVFDYVRPDGVVDQFSDETLINGSWDEKLPPIQWLNGYGQPRSDWQDQIPLGTVVSPDDAVFPADLQRADFFRRRGCKVNDNPGPRGFVMGDFGDMRQFVLEYDATRPELADVRQKYGAAPVLNILIRAYQYLVAKYDIDGFRIDTAKYVSSHHLETFGNAMREFAQEIGKRNFFTFGEIYDSEQTIAKFVGRDSQDVDGFGVDAALDFPLFYKLPVVVKSLGLGVESIREVFQTRKDAEKNSISSHGEAGQYFVSFLDNHDQTQRFHHPATPPNQITMGLAVLFTLQGIPCIYYGTEQGLTGTVDANGTSDLEALESVREALWGKPHAFDNSNDFYKHVQSLSTLRNTETALRYGRLYFREVSGNGQDFGHSSGVGGVLAFSRILNDREILITANTSTTQVFNGFALQDPDLNRSPQTMRVVYSNQGNTLQCQVRRIPQARFWESGQSKGVADAAAVFVSLAPAEVQILVPA